MGIPDHLTCLLRNLYAGQEATVRTEWWTGSKLGKEYIKAVYCQFSSITQSCPTLWDPMDCSTPGFSVYHQLLELTQTHVHWIGDGTNHLILCWSLLLPTSIFPSIRVFSNESVHCIRWPKYWSFSFRINPSNEYLGLISFRIDRLDLLAVQGISRLFSNTTVQKRQCFGAQLSL